MSADGPVRPRTADIAFAKVGVAGSNPVVRSRSQAVSERRCLWSCNGSCNG